MADELTQALADLEEEKVEVLLEARLADGVDPSSILRSAQDGMRQVGERYETGDYFVSDLMMSSAIFKKIVARLDPLLVGTASVSRGSVVMGTVKGDVHDIGKDLVVSTLRASGYDVTDLGVNVTPERFVAALEQTGAPILALSGLLTISFEPMRETVDAVTAAGLRSRVKIMLGGGPVTEQVLGQAGADALGADPPSAVRIADEWMEAAR
jgi:methanogenic corrinoid protein MtbC1